METTLGKRIAALRRDKGLKQDELAQQLGVTPQAVSKWENDQTCPDITLLPETDDAGQETGMLRVRINGVDIFKPNTGEICSDNADGIACWFVDTDYDEESFFVRQAYFLGAKDPYKALKITLKAEIDKDAWESLHSDTSRPFPRPEGGRIAVKVINHLGDEVMKVFRV